MANNNRNNTKVGFWKKLFNTAATTESGNNSVDTQQQVNTSPVHDLSADNTELSLVGNNATNEDDGLLEQAVYVSDEQKLTAEPLDETAKALADKELAIQQLEEEIVTLEDRSTLLQQKAVDTLSGLAEAERQYNDANQLALEAADKEAAVRKEQDQYFATAEAENEALIAAAEDEVATIKAVLANKRQELAAALSQIDKVALNLINDQENGQAKEQAKVEAIGQELSILQKYYDQALLDQEAANGKINSLQLAVKRAQNEYDRAAKELSNFEYRFQANQYDEKLASLTSDDQQNQDRLNKELEQTNQLFTQQINDAENKYEQLAHEIADKKDEVADNADKIVVADQTCTSAQNELARLQSEKETIVAESDAELQLISGRVEAARKDVDDKKEAYAEAQKQVQLSTSISVKANAQASAAREKADRAAIEKADAATAAEMAQKLKSDATVARVNTDEASSLLLSRAEMVLLNTSEKAIRLLEEKTSLAEIAQQEAAHLRSEADVAAAEAKRAAGIADKMISLWLSAEENLVKVVTAAEENKRQVEERTALVVEQYDQNITAAQQVIAQQQQESLTAAAARDKAQEELASCEQKYTQVAQQIEELKDNYAAEQARIEKELAETIAAAKQAIAACQEEQSMVSAKIDDKRAAFEYRESQLAALIDELNTEQENYRSQLDQTNDQLSKYQDAISQRQSEHQIALAEMNSLMRDTLSYLASCRSKAERVAANVAELEQELNHALANADKIEEESVDRLVQVRNDAEKAIAVATKATDDARTTAENYYAQLQEARSDAEAKVKAAVDASVARLDALNRVSCQYTEKEIFCLDNSIQTAEENMLSAKSAFEEAKSIFLALEQAVTSLVNEKTQLTDEYNGKYQALNILKAKETDALDQEIAFLSKIEQECQTALNAAHTIMDKIAIEYSAAQDRLHACMAEKDKLTAESSDQLAALNEDYRIAMEGEGQEIPLLRKVFEDCKQKRDQAIAAFTAADSQWHQQVEIASGLRNDELAFNQDSANQMAQLKADNAARLQETQEAINALETHKQELDTAYAKAQTYTATNAAAQQEAERYLQHIVEEEQQQQDAVDNDLHKINEHLQLLKEDVDAKQQKYRETANIIKNSQQLMKEAEDNLTLAKNAFNKAEAELNAAEAAFKTSTALADQAAQSYQSVDNETAAILKRASEELVVAADNAAVFVEEKKKDYLLAQEILQVAKHDFDSISKTVNEAPDLADEEKVIWLKADEEYKKYQQEAEQRIPAIKKAFADFLAERANAKAAAQSTVDKCAKESEETKQKVSTLSSQIMETLAEISHLTSERQALENNIIEHEAQVERDIENALRAKKATRENAEELANRLEMAMLQRKEERDSALEHFEKAKAHYQQACALVDQQYHDDKNDIENKLAKMVHNAENANTIFKSIAELRKKAADELTVAQERYQTTVEYKEHALAAKAKLIENKDAELHELEEVKLRVLSNNAMARIAAEEKAAKANKEYLQKKACFEDADKALQGLLQQRDLAVKKLETLQDDGERAIAAAKENILYMMKDTAI